MPPALPLRRPPVRLPTARVAAILALLSGCGGPEGGGTVVTDTGRTPDAVAQDAREASAGSGTGLPCGVERLLATSCAGCHGSPTAEGAPQTLRTRADLMAMSEIEPSQSLAERSLARIEDADRPMPPSGPTPAAADVTALRTWISDGMPETTCTMTVDAGIRDAGRPDGQVPVDARPGVDADTTVGGDLPCDVAAVLRTYCVSCHGNPPSGGATYTILRRADLLAAAPGFTGQTVLQRSIARMTDTARPMPPSGARPSSTDVMALQSWQSAGAPAGSCGTGPDGGAPPPSDAGVVTNLPCDVETLLRGACVECHSNPPTNGAPMPLVTWSNLAARSSADPSQSFAQRALVRMRLASNPMPPAGHTAPAATAITAYERWLTTGMARATCGGSSGTDPLNAAPRCTSNLTWFLGNSLGDSMNPGEPCIQCHTNRGSGPRYQIAGTIYPSGHEPTNCIPPLNINAGVTIEVTDMRGQVLRISPNIVGNFHWQGTFTPPYTARVVMSDGRSRAMIAPQTNGDCNVCHTASGTMAAPGRITLPAP